VKNSRVELVESERADSMRVGDQLRRLLAVDSMEDRVAVATTVTR
jgi:hypothetical protein